VRLDDTGPRRIDRIEAIGRRHEPVFAMLAEDCLDLVRVEPPLAAAEPGGDPLRLGRELGLLDVLLAPRPVEEDDGDEPTTGDQADEEQPPLELGHQRWPGV
jgi:hypothetical protein